MDGSKTIMVTSGQYNFQIIDNTLFSRDKTEIYSRNFTQFRIFNAQSASPSSVITPPFGGVLNEQRCKIGGTYPDCVNISVIYENNTPVDACMPNLFSDPECSFYQPLDKGDGTIRMIKTLLNYVYTQLPTLAYVKFDDKSSIECATKEELKKGSRFRKRGTHVKPIPLYYFSILFNGQTWYEKHFNAKQKDDVRHQLYRTRVDDFLNSKEFKTNMGFDKFVSLFDKREEEMSVLYQYYKSSNTFYEFFRAIPIDDRCRLVGPWIEQQMISNFRKMYGNPDEVVICIGDWEQRQQMKYKEPTLGIGIRSLLRKNKYNVYLVDEFRTSCKCSNCDGGVCEKYMVRKNPRPKPKKNKENPKKERKYDEMRLVHGLLRCKSGCGEWNRDRNGSSNIYKIAFQAIHNLERPSYLCREIKSNQAVLPNCYKQNIHKV